MNRRISKILIANRGEIALRVMRTCKELGIQTVGVYSEADILAPHVRFADESYLLGPAPASESYLSGDRILDIARRTQTDAIHPGYGFLSENPSFAQSVEEAGVIFIGPTPAAMKTMGDKTAARRLAAQLSIPFVPGTTSPIEDVAEVKRLADGLGYPILLKAAGGGGGKGMRIVQSPKEIESLYSSARSEAKSAFGDDRVYVEKYIKNPRHVEVQVLADRLGNAIHLGERDCSIQRRHQKIVEESPSPVIDEELRKRMTSAALSLVTASGYTNAGTIEFILDSEGNFYFLETNARLQVEHPVTEMRTGIDLVREQIRIAEGFPLELRQEDIRFSGHAIECRIYAEDSTNNFLPSTGSIVSLRSSTASGVREDRGVEDGSEISTYYDPMISKIIGWGISRDEAISRLRSTLESYELYGVRNNIDLCLWVLSHPEFLSGKYNTHFLNDRFTTGEIDKHLPELEILAVAAALVTERASQAYPVSQSNHGVSKRWSTKRLDYMR